MDKSPDAFRTISEVADWLETPAHVLRFWESRFSQVKPVKRAGGRRYYRPADMALLGGIKKLLHEDGMTIRGVQKLLREHGVGHVSAMSPDENTTSDPSTSSAPQAPTDTVQSILHPSDSSTVAPQIPLRGHGISAPEAPMAVNVPQEPEISDLTPTIIPFSAKDARPEVDVSAPEVPPINPPEIDVLVIDEPEIDVPEIKETVTETSLVNDLEVNDLEIEVSTPSIPEPKTFEAPAPEAMPQDHAAAPLDSPAGDTNEPDFADAMATQNSEQNDAENIDFDARQPAQNEPQAQDGSALQEAFVVETATTGVVFDVDLTDEIPVQTPDVAPTDAPHEDPLQDHVAQVVPPVDPTSDFAVQDSYDSETNDLPNEPAVTPEAIEPISIPETDPAQTDPEPNDAEPQTAVTPEISSDLIPDFTPPMSPDTSVSSAISSASDVPDVTTDIPNPTTNDFVEDAEISVDLGTQDGIEAIVTPDLAAELPTVDPIDPPASFEVEITPTDLSLEPPAAEVVFDIAESEPTDARLAAKDIVKTGEAPEIIKPTSDFGQTTFDFPAEIPNATPEGVQPVEAVTETVTDDISDEITDGMDQPLSPVEPTEISQNHPVAPVGPEIEPAILETGAEPETEAALEPTPEAAVRHQMLADETASAPAAFLDQPSEPDDVSDTVEEMQPAVDPIEDIYEETSPEIEAIVPDEDAMIDVESAAATSEIAATSQIEPEIETEIATDSAPTQNIAEDPADDDEGFAGSKGVLGRISRRDYANISPEKLVYLTNRVKELREKLG